mmetsp:Transcript_113141/g.205763  ORF Transcript_113141/g.205763 Transcript_113141/m.205763 type:complete len:234 (-) Transcript_113141:80-781(-)
MYWLKFRKQKKPKLLAAFFIEGPQNGNQKVGRVVCKAGGYARLQGLQERDELNDKIVQLASYDESTERWRATLVDGGRVVKVCARNLKPVASPANEAVSPRADQGVDPPAGQIVSPPVDQAVSPPGEQAVSPPGDQAVSPPGDQPVDEACVRETLQVLLECGVPESRAGRLCLLQFWQSLRTNMQYVQIKVNEMNLSEKDPKENGRKRRYPEGWRDFRDQKNFSRRCEEMQRR